MRKNALIAGAMYAGMIVSTAVWFAVAQGFMDGHDAAGMLAALQAAQGRFEWSIVLGAVMGLMAVAREVDVLVMLRGAGGAATARDVALAMAGFRNLFVVSMVFSALWFFSAWVAGLPGIIGEVGTCLSLLVYGLRRGKAPRVEKLRQAI